MKLIALLTDLAKRYENLIKYAMVGVTGICLDFAVFFLLNKKLGIHYEIANIISVSCGITNNFFLNAFFNFKRKDRLLFRYIQFYAVGIGGMSANAFLLFICIELFHFEVFVTKLLVGLCVAAGQYVMNKTFSFRR